MLRGVAVGETQQLDPFRTLLNRPTRALSGDLLEMRKPSPPPAREPWRAGYEMALDVRRALGWGDEPTPELGSFLPAMGLDLREDGLSGGVVCAVSGFTPDRARVIVNPSGTMSWSMTSAAALGHVLFDLPLDRDF